MRLKNPSIEHSLPFQIQAQCGPWQTMTCKWQSPHSARFGSTISLSPNFQTTVDKNRTCGCWKFILNDDADFIRGGACNDLLCQLTCDEMGDRLLVQRRGNTFLIEESCLGVCDQSPAFHRCRSWVWQCNLICRVHVNLEDSYNCLVSSVVRYPRVGFAEKTL